MSILLHSWLIYQVSHSKQHDTCHHCKACASFHCQRPSFIMSNCRLFAWLSSDPYRPNLSYSLVSTPMPPKRHYPIHTTTKTYPLWFIGLLHSSDLPNTFYNELSFSSFQIRYGSLIPNASLHCHKAKRTVFNPDVVCSEYDSGINTED